MPLTPGGRSWRPEASLSLHNNNSEFSSSRGYTVRLSQKEKRKGKESVCGGGGGTSVLPRTLRSKVLRQKEAGLSVGQAMGSRQKVEDVREDWDLRPIQRGLLKQEDRGLGTGCPTVTPSGSVWRTQWAGAEGGLSSCWARPGLTVVCL